MVFYGLVDDELGEIVEFFAGRSEAEQALRDVLDDEPGWEGVISVVRSTSAAPR